jgi:hypothetical protein
VGPLWNISKLHKNNQDILAKIYICVVNKSRIFNMWV